MMVGEQQTIGGCGGVLPCSRMDVPTVSELDDTSKLLRTAHNIPARSSFGVSTRYHRSAGHATLRGPSAVGAHGGSPAEAPGAAHTGA
jgi:hypothetical protein